MTESQQDPSEATSENITGAEATDKMREKMEDVPDNPIEVTDERINVQPDAAPQS